MALSLAIVILASLLADYLLRRVKLPGLPGMLAVGMVCGPYGLKLLSPALLSVSADLRRLALIVIFLRAGVMISRRTLNVNRGRVLPTAFVPPPPATAPADVSTETLPPPPTTPPTTTTPRPIPSINPEPRETLVIHGVGDVALDPNYITTFRTEGYAYAWSGLEGIFENDDLTIIKSMKTDAFNHAPAQILMNTGSQQFGKPSLGAWSLYGLGSESRDLPGFVVFSSGTKGPSGGNSNWGSGFLPTVHQGVTFRTTGDPVLYLSNPPGMSEQTRRRMLDDLASLNKARLDEVGDPEIATRIAQYELAYRMQSSRSEEHTSELQSH